MSAGAVPADGLLRLERPAAVRTWAGPGIRVIARFRDVSSSVSSSAQLRFLLGQGLFEFCDLLRQLAGAGLLGELASEHAQHGHDAGGKVRCRGNVGAFPGGDQLLERGAESSCPGAGACGGPAPATRSAPARPTPRRSSSARAVAAAASARSAAPHPHSCGSACGAGARTGHAAPPRPRRRNEPTKSSRTYGTHPSQQRYAPVASQIDAAARSATEHETSYEHWRVVREPPAGVGPGKATPQPSVLPTSRSSGRSNLLAEYT